jgi:hypothetical protein
MPIYIRGASIDCRDGQPCARKIEMVPDQTSIACRFAAPIVIDDRRRLPGRFFGRFTTSATSGLARAL